MKPRVSFVGLTFFMPALLYCQSAPTPHIISFFMVPCASNPTCAKKFPQEKLPEKISHLDMSTMILERHTTSPLVQGIYVNYLGYLTYTDYNGQIILPLKESGNQLTVVVTHQIYPVIFQGLTVHHFEIPQEVDAAVYRYVLHHDETHNTWSWDITPLERPASSKVDTNALIIMARPHEIEIVPGTHTSIPGPNFILPDIFVHAGIDTPGSILKFLKINRFFEPLIIEKKFGPLYIQQAVQQ